MKIGIILWLLLKKHTFDVVEALTTQSLLWFLVMNWGSSHFFVRDRRLDFVVLNSL
ncbi:hypothetical protein Plhal304r1_c064g0151321 [Plasmopara halstedii]